MDLIVTLYSTTYSILTYDNWGFHNYIQPLCGGKCLTLVNRLVEGSEFIRLYNPTFFLFSYWSSPYLVRLLFGGGGYFLLGLEHVSQG